VYLLLSLDAIEWANPNQKMVVLTAIQCLKENLTGLLQFDVDFMVTWGQPTDGNMLWKWLTQEVFSQLKGLEQFVLKVSVLKPLLTPVDRRCYDDWDPDVEPLEFWNEEEYQNLKLAVTRTHKYLGS
jgi:hypothetical protein